MVGRSVESMEVTYDNAIVQPFFQYIGGGYRPQRDPTSPLTPEQPFTLKSSSSVPTLQAAGLEDTLKPQFNVSVAYAYIGPRTSGFSEPNPMSTSSSIPTLYAKSLYPSLICLNVTRLSAVEKGYDATVDVFLIQLKSDKEDTENYLYSMGTNSNASFSDFNSVSQAISSKINNFANIRTINGGESYFAVNTTSNQSILGTSVGSIGSYTNKQ